MQKFICVGNLTRDPEMSATPSGISVCKFSIAVNRDFADTDGKRETDFFNIVVWRGLADNCGKYLKKGNKVAIVGKLQNRTYEAADGTKRTFTEVIAEQVEFLQTKNNADDNAKHTPKCELTPEADDENLPF